MIPFKVTYIRPESAQEAAEAFREISDSGRSPRFIAGGTEVVTKARDHALTADALIDLKHVPEARACERDATHTWFGAALTVNDVIETDPCPLLTETLRRIGDHTVRNSITLGGNIAGQLPYREAVLPFLLFDGRVEVAGPDGIRTVPLAELFDKRLRLGKGEYALRFRLPNAASQAPSFYRRRTRDSRIDYPLMTLCMAAFGGAVRFAVSGVLSYPVRDARAEEALNGSGQAAPDRVAAAVEKLPGRLHEDMRGSADYRRALLLAGLLDGLGELESKS